MPSIINGNSTRTKILTDELEAMRWPYYMILPITWLLALWMMIKRTVNTLLKKEQEVGLLIFDGIGNYGKVVKKNVTGWKAVDLIYNHRFKKNLSFGGMLDDFWFNSLNCQAARNRFKLAKKELEKAIFSLSNQDEIKILSTASGTGQIEIETIAKLRKQGMNIKAVLLDKDEEALSKAQNYVSVNKVAGSIETINQDVSKSVNMAEQLKPNIVTMVALLDYLSKEDAIKLISKFYELLPENGVFIASNTMPNVEMHYVKWFVNWPLIYRKPCEIKDIIKKSGFKNCEIIKEPLNIQCVAVGKKI